jgi:hypothetical protein
MVKLCCYSLCKSDTRKDENIEFIPFPKPKTNLERAKRWVHLCGRANFSVEKITSHTYICSKHFGRGENLNLQANLTFEPFPAHSEELFRQRHEQSLRRISRHPLTSEVQLKPPNLASESLKSFTKSGMKCRVLPMCPPSPDQIDVDGINMKGKFKVAQELCYRYPDPRGTVTTPALYGTALPPDANQ